MMWKDVPERYSHGIFIDNTEYLTTGIDGWISGKVVEGISVELTEEIFKEIVEGIHMNIV